MNRKNKVLIIVFTILVLLLVDLVLNKSTTENISKEDLIIETIDSFGITTSTLDYIEELVFVEQINGGYVCVAVTYGKQIVVAYLETDIFQNDELWVSAYRKATLNVLLASTKSDFSKLYAGNMNSKKFYFNFSEYDGEEGVTFNGTEISVHTLDILGKKVDFWFCLEE